MTIMGRWAAVLGLLILAGPEVGAAADPVGDWRWQGLRGVEPLEIEKPSHYALELRADGSYSVRADCNRGSGSYLVEGGELRLAPAAMTLAACSPGSHDQRYLRLLGEHRRPSRNGDQLVLASANGASQMMFTLAKSVALPGTRWNVRAVNDGKQAVKSLLRDSALEFSFLQDGTISGSAGCNRFVAGFTLEAEELHFAPPAATRRFCGKPDGLMEQEAAFLAALETVARYEVDGDRLALRREDGALAIDCFAGVTGELVYHRREAFPPGTRVEIVLENVSLADVAATRLARQDFEIGDRRPPLAFELRYDPARIEARHTYSVRARITDASGKLLFTTTTANRVITADSPIAGIELLLDRNQSP